MLSIAFPASSQSLGALLRELDAVIEQKDEYARRKHETVNRLRWEAGNADGQEKYILLDKLYSEYNTYDIDSALTYGTQKAILARSLGLEAQYEESMLNVADVYIYAGMYSEAESILSECKARTAVYYHVQHALYSALGQGALFRDRKGEYQILKENYRDSLINSLPENDIGRVFAYSEKLLEAEDYYEAIKYIEDAYKTIDVPARFSAILDFSLAVAYKGMHNRERAKWYFAKSAISDLQAPVKEYKSLHELSFMLFEDGDVKRANKYITCSMEDVLSSNSKIRVMEFTPVLSMISSAYESMIKSQNRTLTVLLVLVFVVIVLLAVAVVYTVRARRNIRKTAKELETSYSELKDANRKLVEITAKIQEIGCIKEEYLYRYMEQASECIDQLESYRRRMLLTYRKGGVERMLAEMEQPFNVEDELRAFYSSFDETFLHLFPSFVEDVNALLVKEAALCPKSDRLLNTELRILALIRLGVTDSVTIAHFLHCSLSTIYNYRTRLRNSAISGRNDFEESIAGIGLYKLN